MESFLQSRRLRREVEEELARSQAKSTRTSTSSPSLSSDPELGVPASEKPLTTDGPLVPGVTISKPDRDDGKTVSIVGWKDNDSNNPQNWSLFRKWMVMMTCCLIAIAMTIPSSVEGATQDAFDTHFGVNSMAGSMTTGIFLIGIGVGSLFSGPFSETLGRNIVYFAALILVILFTMAKALAPNYGAALAFRFLNMDQALELS
ncbi:Major facilitator superfamily domain general substrate transporter [Penicillium herquei]|nr:Major facilitator superfamily domain general substrate transporter [Penicillium herquei]